VHFQHSAKLSVERRQTRNIALKLTPPITPYISSPFSMHGFWGEAEAIDVIKPVRQVGMAAKSRNFMGSASEKGEERIERRSREVKDAGRRKDSLDRVVRFL
jgi:hypothetical protein